MIWYWPKGGDAVRTGGNQSLNQSVLLVTWPK